MLIRTGLSRISLVILCLSGVFPVWGEPADPVSLALAGSQTPKIALIIDDLGNWRQAGLRAVSLPGPVACAILPHTPFASLIAERAFVADKEVMLHLPLEPIEHDTLALGTIDITATRSQLARIFAADIKSVPHVVGVNNHMGSLLTQHPGHMAWLMDEMREQGGLFFVDSYTSEASIALKIATETGVPTIRRDVFLDNVATEEAIDRQFERLKTLARRNGVAVGIGHPYPATLSYLERVLPELASEGFVLITVADSIQARALSVNVSVAQH